MITIKDIAGLAGVSKSTVSRVLTGTGYVNDETREKIEKIIKENIIPITIWTIFEIIAITLFLSTKKIFYLLNFTYIGTCVGAGISLMIYKKKYARHFVQLGVGIYMLIYVGILS